MILLKHVFLVAVTVLLFCNACSLSTKKEVKITQPVKLAVVENFSTVSRKFGGVVAPEELSYLSFKTAGTIISLGVEEGQTIKKGQVVAQLDPADLKLDLNAKSSAFQTAKAQIERAEKLLTKSAISQQDYETQKANYEKAKSDYEYAKSNVYETRLVAPFTGFIQKKYVENHQKVNAGQQVVCLINPDKLKIQVTIPETSISTQAVNKEILVTFDTYKEIQFKAVIRDYLRSSTDGAGITLYLAINDPRFNTTKYHIGVGFACIVEFIGERLHRENCSLIPLSAVFSLPNNKYGIFIYDSTTQKVVSTEITMGEVIENDKVIVTSPLTAGTRVVSAGTTRLKDGDVVKPL